MKKILACIDGSGYSESVCDHAAWAGSRTGATVEVLTVLPQAPERGSLSDLSGAIGFDASSELLKEFTEHDEAQGRLEHRKGRLILELAEERLRADGVERITTLKRRGTLAETIHDLETGAELIVMGKRGELAESDPMHIGSNLERVARAVKSPLLVATGGFRPARRFLIAYDGGPSSARALEYIARSQLFKGLECHILTVGRESDALREGLDSASADLELAGFNVRSGIEPGYPDEAIRKYVESMNIDLLVLGAYGHSRIRSLIIGSTTTSLIMSCPVPLLLFR